jgi:cytosine deaminase
MCNMYLQDRTEPGRTPHWRGITLLHELSAAGVPVAVGSDNTRDPFYAYGDLDPIEVFAQAVRIAQLDSPLGGWARAVTATPASVMRTDVAGLLGQGRNADLIVFPRGPGRSCSLGRADPGSSSAAAVPSPIRCPTIVNWICSAVKLG